MNKEAMYKALEVRKDTLLTYLKTLLTALMLDISAVIGISYKKGMEGIIWEILGLISIGVLASVIKKVTGMLTSVENEFRKLGGDR